MGTASLFSLATNISVGGGGMIVLNNESMSDDFEKEVYALEKPSITDEIKHIFIAYMRSFFYHKPWFGLFALPVGLLIENKVDLMDKKNSKVTATYKSDLDIMLKKLVTFKSKVELQRDNSFFLIEELKDTSLILPHEKKDTYCNYYLFPVLFENERQRNKASEYLREKGIDTSTLFSLTPNISKLLYGYQGDCPYTEQVAERILTIPNHYILKQEELEMIINSIKSYMEVKDLESVV
jgi:dTDP-4-amino-4,6-dideoxygalactose transaminase